MNKIVDLIKAAKNIVLSTHRQCDGDGLGAELGVYHALKKMGKNVKVINVDKTPRKYRFLNPDQHIQYFETNAELPSSIDLLLIFDTNDERLVEPLYTAIKPKANLIAFIDHHPILNRGPKPSAQSYIDIKAASTGEIAFNIVKDLGVSLDKEISRCFYTSIAFDTQLFRFIRNSARSHEIAAELLHQKIDINDVHRHLFGNQTVQKMAFLAKALGQIEYYCEGRLAVLKLKDADLFHYNLDPDDSRDVIDMLMNIETLEAAALFREDSDNKFKLSLRSKGKIQVLEVAESLGGGGHVFASGASITGDYTLLKKQVIDDLSSLLAQIFKTVS